MNQGVGRKKLRSNGSDSSAARLAYDQLHRQVIECRLSPGERLTETSVAERLGLGKTPVREALRQLMVEGLVLVAPRQGYSVAPITIRDVDELFQLRRIMESAAAKMAADHHDPSCLARLKQWSQVSWATFNGRSLRKFLKLNTAFHLAIAKLSGNRRIVQIISQLLSESDRLINFGMTQRPKDAESTIAQHGTLTEAILRGDPQAAGRIAEEHVEATRRMIIEALLADTRFREIPIS